MPKVTVIVPAYNVEKFIEETLDCLLGQTLKDIEVIIVDDGSTDSTAEVIKKYCQKHSIFKSIYQNNAGVSAARNTAIPLATGEYVCFLDSDDVYTPESLEGFYNKAKETDADLVIGRLKSFGAGISEYNIYADKLSKKETIETYDLDLLWNFLVGNKFYKREKLIQSGVTFPSLTYSEEGVFFTSFVYTGAKITGTTNSTMCYRRHTKDEGLSVSQSVNLSLIQNFIASLNQIYNNAKNSFDVLNPDIDRERYLQEILYKTANILLFQFYRHFWRVDDECMQYIKQEFDRLFSGMSEETQNKLRKEQSDISLDNLETSKKIVAENAQISVIIGGKKHDMNSTIEAIFESSYPYFEVIVSQSTYSKMTNQRKKCENVIVLPDKNFFFSATKKCKGKFIVRLSKPTNVNDRLFRYLIRFDAPEFAKRLGFSVLFKLAMIKISKSS